MAASTPEPAQVQDLGAIHSLEEVLAGLVDSAVRRAQVVSRAASKT